MPRWWAGSRLRSVRGSSLAMSCTTTTTLRAGPSDGLTVDPSRHAAQVPVRVEGERVLLQRGVGDELTVPGQDLLHRLGRTGPEPGPDRVAVDDGLGHHRARADGHHRRVGLE